MVVGCWHGIPHFPLQLLFQLHYYSVYHLHIGVATNLEAESAARQQNPIGDRLLSERASVGKNWCNTTRDPVCERGGERAEGEEGEGGVLLFVLSAGLAELLSSAWVVARQRRAAPPPIAHFSLPPPLPPASRPRSTILGLAYISPLPII